MGLRNLPRGYSNPSTLNATSLRIDHSFNARFTLFGRYKLRSIESFSRAGDGLRSLNSVRVFSNRTQTLTVGATNSFSATTFNELRFNFSNVSGKNRGNLDTVLKIYTFGGAAVPADSFFFPHSCRFQMPSSGFQLLEAEMHRFQAGTNVSNRQRQFNLSTACLP